MGFICTKSRVTAAVLAALCYVSPAQAVTCQEARGLSAKELAHWAERLQVTPAYLGALLEKAFCESGSSRGFVKAPDKRDRAKPLSVTSGLLD
jgi:hypothetical protein